MKYDETNAAHGQQLALAKKLLQTVRHAAYSTVNEDGSPHNSPLMLIHNDSLTKFYIGSYSESLHSKNIERSGLAFAVIFDSFTKGQGGLYVHLRNGHEAVRDELLEALRVHNGVRAKHGSAPIALSFYQLEKPSQRMYEFDVEKIEIYSSHRNKEGLIQFEERIEVDPSDLLA